MVYGSECASGIRRYYARYEAGWPAVLAEFSDVVSSEYVAERVYIAMAHTDRPLVRAALSLSRAAPSNK